MGHPLFLCVFLGGGGKLKDGDDVQRQKESEGEKRR